MKVVIVEDIISIDWVSVFVGWLRTPLVKSVLQARPNEAVDDASSDRRSDAVLAVAENAFKQSGTR